MVGEAALNVSARITPAFEVESVRAQFPILQETVRGKPLVFLDSAASAQKPLAVIEAMTHAMRTQYANVHRGLHWMSERTTDAYEGTRDAVARLINAPDRREIVFTRNTTEAINLVAHSFGRGMMRAGDAVVISAMEHHSNMVPWQMLRDARGVEPRVAPITDAGELDMDGLEATLADGRVRLVAVTHMSNVLGSYTPAARIAALAHAHGARVLFDGSQAVVHRRVDVQAIDADFYVFTGHKLYGPTGIGVLWGARGTARGDAALPGRRRHDRDRRLRTLHLGGDSAQVRGGDAGDPGEHRAGGGDRLRRTHRLRGDRGARGGADRARAGSAVCHPRAARDRPGTGTAAAWSASRWTGRTRTTSPPCWIGRASRCAPGITAPSR